MTSIELAQASNAAVYATMVSLSLAMVCFAISFAVGRRRPMAAPVRVEVLQVAGSTDVIEQAAPQPADPIEPGRRAANIGMSLTWLSFFTLLIGVVLRGVWAGRVPWGNMYEFSITAALGVAVAFLAFSLKRDVRWLGIFVTIPVLLTLGSAITFLYTDAAALVPALKSYWLVIHVLAAVICGGAFCVGAAVTLLFLVADTGERKAAAGDPYWLDGLARRLPESTRLDAMAYRIHAFMFPLWTFAIVAGAIWAENAWGRYWGWDPKETWAFITWVVYAGYLHARATAGWKGRKAAYLALVGLATLWFNFIGINYFSTTSQHSYAAPANSPVGAEADPVGLLVVL